MTLATQYHCALFVGGKAEAHSLGMGTKICRGFRCYDGGRGGQSVAASKVGITSLAVSFIFMYFDCGLGVPAASEQREFTL